MKCFSSIADTYIIIRYHMIEANLNNILIVIFLDPYFCCFVEQLYLNYPIQQYTIYVKKSAHSQLKIFDESASPHTFNKSNIILVASLWSTTLKQMPFFPSKLLSMKEMASQPFRKMYMRISNNKIKMKLGPQRSDLRITY